MNTSNIIRLLENNKIDDARDVIMLISSDTDIDLLLKSLEVKLNETLKNGDYNKMNYARALYNVFAYACIHRADIAEEFVRNIQSEYILGVILTENIDTYYYTDTVTCNFMNYAIGKDAPEFDTITRSKAKIVGKVLHEYIYPMLVKYFKNKSNVTLTTNIPFKFFPFNDMLEWNFFGYTILGSGSNTIAKYGNITIPRTYKVNIAKKYKGKVKVNLDGIDRVLKQLETPRTEFCRLSNNNSYPDSELQLTVTPEAVITGKQETGKILSLRIILPIRYADGYYYVDTSCLKNKNFRFNFTMAANDYPHYQKTHNFVSDCIDEIGNNLLKIFGNRTFRYKAPEIVIMSPSKPFLAEVIKFNKGGK